MIYFYYIIVYYAVTVSNLHGRIIFVIKFANGKILHRHICELTCFKFMQKNEKI